MATINGTSGNDDLTGTDQQDEIHAGDGNDEIDGLLGADILYGEGGDDTFVFTAVRSDDIVRPNGLIDGGIGHDGIDLTGVSPVAVKWSDAEQQIIVGTQVFDLAGVEEIRLGNGANVLSGVLGKEAHLPELSLYLGGGGDSAFVDGAIDIYGEGGNDAFFLSPVIGTPFLVNALVDGGSGIDAVRLNIGFTVDLLHGTANAFSSRYTLAGIEVVEGVADVNSAYSSTIYGNGGANTFRVWADNTSAADLGVTYYGRGGRDYLSGSNGRDTLNGGPGDDYLIGGGGNDLLVGDIGLDTVSYENAADGVLVQLTKQGIAQDTLAGGLDTLSGIENAVGSNFADRLVGNNDANALTGLDGRDILDGKLGDDTLSGGNGNDRVVGDGGNDTLHGDGGNDRMMGGADVDTMFGGAGHDKYYVDVAGDIVTELAGEGTDTVVATLDYVLGDNVENLVLGTGDWDGTGNALANVINGSSGANTLLGLGGNDFINGKAGIDVLDGGAGSDRLFGGTGRDVMTGGTGGDKFYFQKINESGNLNGSADVILDFSQSQGDRIVLNAIDANSATSRDDAFAFIGNAAFSNTAGELRYSFVSGGRTLVEMDVNGDGISDMSIRLEGQIDLTAADFIL